MAIKYQALHLAEVVIVHLYDFWNALRELSSKKVRDDLIQAWLLCQEGDELFGFAWTYKVEKALAKHADSFAVDSHLDLTIFAKKNARLSKLLFNKMSSVSVCFSRDTHIR